MIKEIHASQIISYKVCPRLYYWQYNKNLAHRDPAPKLFLGSGFHAAVAAYYQGEEDPVQVFKSWCNAEMLRVEALVTTREQYDELIKQQILGVKMIGAYIAFAQANDNFVPLAIEQQFAVPIYSPQGNICHGAKHVGTFDGIVEDAYGNLWLMEHKTAKQFPNETVLRLDEQAGYYLLAASKLFPGRKINGIIYNITRKVDPARAKDEVVKRLYVVRNGYELRSIAKRLYHGYRSIATDKAFMPSPGMHCSWRCGYMPLCVAQEDGSDVNALVDGLYVTRKTPLILEEEAS